MGLNNQSRSLIIASKAQGYDPTRIEGVGSIADFDVDDGIVQGASPVGKLPGGTPDSWPDDWDNGRRDPAVLQDIGSQPPFNNPDVSRENKPRRTSNADPYAGMGGAGG